MSFQNKTKVIQALCYIWIGLLIGVSFYATPIKFLANDVPLNHNLAVGQVTFQYFTWIELTLLIILSVFLARAKLLFIVVFAIILFPQKFILLPVLDSRLELILAGNDVADAHWHSIYIITEFIKLLLLFFLAVKARDEK